MYSKMNPRNSARIVGILFIIATVTGVLSFVFGPDLTALDYLANLAINENKVMMGLLLNFTMAVAIAGIPIFMYPILKQHNEALAVGYVGSRIIESVLIMVGSLTLPLLLTVSQEFVIAGSPETSVYQTLGTLLLAASEWTFWMGVSLVFSITAVILNSLLYRSNLVPRWLSGWGLIGGILYLITGSLGIFGFTFGDIYAAPIALQEMVFAVWLIVKGYNVSAIASPSVSTGGNKEE